MMENKKTNQLLEDIKKLILIDLISRGLQGKYIASVLGVDPAIISRMVPSRLIKKKS